MDSSATNQLKSTREINVYAIKENKIAIILPFNCIFLGIQLHFYHSERRYFILQSKEIFYP